MDTREYDIYMRVLVKALHGTRSTLRATSPTWADRMTVLIEMPRNTIDEIQMFLLKAHEDILEARSSVGAVDSEAASLFDAMHNIPYGLLGRFDGTWDWRESLPDVFMEHESTYLRKLSKYSGLLKNIERPNNTQEGIADELGKPSE